jgi:hypothetical protein
VSAATAPTAGPGLATVRPEYGVASLADIMPGVLTALRVPGAGDPLGLAAGPLRDVRSVAVLLIDGLGHHLLPLAAPHAPALAQLAAASLPGSAARSITTGFPSTTPTSLTSLGTGAAPGSHGLVGFFLNVPGTDRVLNHIAWNDDPDPLRWQPLTTQFDLARAAGVRARVVSRPELAQTGLSIAAYRGGEYVVADHADGLAEQMLAGLRGPGPAVVYGYVPEVDKAGHLFGIDSPQWRLAIQLVDALLERLLARMPAGSALVVTADHGQVDIPAEGRFDIDSNPALSAGLRVVAGEPRVRYLHTVKGAREDVIAAWRGVLGDAAWVVQREQAVAEGWFGPVPEQHLQRIGDVVVACHADHVVLATLRDPPTVAAMVAFHGSATEAEMRIPLLVARR